MRFTFDGAGRIHGAHYYTAVSWNIIRSGSIWFVSVQSNEMEGSVNDPGWVMWLFTRMYNEKNCIILSLCVIVGYVPTSGMYGRKFIYVGIT